MTWTKDEFKEAVKAVLGADTYHRQYVLAEREHDIAGQCKDVAAAVFLGEIQGGTFEQLGIVRETMRRLYRLEGVHGLT